MIRLSCWVGALGCTVGHDALAREGGYPVLSVLQPFTRCIETDVGEIERLKHLVFADATAGLARHFQGARVESATSVDEMKRFLHACKNRLVPGEDDERAEVPASVPSGRPGRTACLTDS